MIFDKEAFINVEWDEDEPQKSLKEYISKKSQHFDQE